MKKILLASLAVILSISTSYARNFNHDVSLLDGNKLVVISIGSENTNSREMVQRIRTLERAVRDLQEIVYDLRSNPQQESRYACEAVTCRRSSSIHANSAKNCNFFGLMKSEVVNVWAMSGSEAEKIASAKLESDSDIVAIGATPSCSVID
jgi:hypothetical protein